MFMNGVYQQSITAAQREVEEKIVDKENM